MKVFGEWDNTFRLQDAHVGAYQEDASLCFLHRHLTFFKLASEAYRYCHKSCALLVMQGVILAMQEANEQEAAPGA